MGIQSESQQYKKPQVTPAIPGVRDNDFKKQGLDQGKKVSSEIEDVEEESDSARDDADQDHE